MPASSHATYRWNGTAFTPETALAVADRGFRYGMMVFETLALRKGRAVFLDEHLERLRAACEETGLTFPENIGALPTGPECGIARLYVTAGPGQADAPAGSGEFLFQWEKRPSSLPDSYRLDDRVRPVLPVWPGLKTGNYWAHIRALQSARDSGFNEAVLTNPQGLVIGAAMANIFARIDGQLATPPLSTGARDGVTRSWVMQHRAVHKVDFTTGDLARADEIFLTSSGLGIMPVSHFGNRPLPSIAEPESLRREFEQAVHEDSR